MSTEDHPAFKASFGGWWCTASDQVFVIKHHNIPLDQLRAIAADRDLPITTRQAAERKARQLSKLAAN